MVVLADCAKHVENLWETCGFLPTPWLCQVVLSRKSSPARIKALLKRFGFHSGLVFGATLLGVYYVLLPDFPEARSILRDICQLVGESGGVFEYRYRRKGPLFSPTRPQYLGTLALRWGKRRYTHWERFYEQIKPSIQERGKEDASSNHR